VTIISTRNRKKKPKAVAKIKGDKPTTSVKPAKKKKNKKQKTNDDHQQQL